ncbi:Isoaspartyl aminopeptidase @ Asp-X dipeptidase [hydrothermal vent metagenome]|uniref:Isoaspartyl aminopeptidase @ Asp-X dipeptidase n=1 Tax=hydrothermal vent metagenome TaxID=652676 RepID=A0A3B0U9D3_9ZZZZ
MRRKSLQAIYQSNLLFLFIYYSKNYLNLIMKAYLRIVPILIISILFFSCTKDEKTEQIVKSEVEQPNNVGPITLVIHGGAGTILKENMSPEKEKAYRDKLEEALQTGYKILEEGGTSMSAVVATIQVMEESPLFNSGVGAVYTHEGRNELDASVMDGNTGKAGAVAGVTTIKSPIRAALEVMNNSPHVMMAGSGAETFAEEQGLEMVDNSYFGTERRKKALEKVLEMEAEKTSDLLQYQNWKYGTVGAVALDKKGNIAAGTSTGGMTNKRYGRIGDSPIIGAGTFAENSSCGVSATGHGEYFIRNAVAYDIAARMKYLNISVGKSAKEVIQKKLVEKGGFGGVVCLDRAGNIAMEFNTAGMYRGYMKNGKAHVYIYKNPSIN